MPAPTEHGSTGPNAGPPDRDAVLRFAAELGRLIGRQLARNPPHCEPDPTRPPPGARSDTPPVRPARNP
jgi:hypothetical protein